MAENLYNEEKLRRFLLEDLSESERARIEERFLVDEDFATQLCVVEDELIESYLGRRLSATDRQRFEAAFLTQPRRRERVLMMKGVLAAISAEPILQPQRTPSVWDSLLAFVRFQNAVARYAFAAVVVFLLAFGALLLFNKLGPKQSGPVAQQTPGSIRPGGVPSVSPDPSLGISRPGQSPSPEVTPVPGRPSPTTETQPAAPTFATIILRPTLVRDPGAANKLVVSSSIQQVHLLLNLDRNSYRAYAVRVTTVDGRLVWQAASIHARTTNGRASLALSVPAQQLATDDYLVEVDGVSDAGSRESLASYFFSITRK